jgi:hypothetical protein
VEDVNVLLPHAPDGGFGWVVVACAFVCNFVYGGCDYSFGVLLPHLEREYDTGSALSAFAGSLCTSVFYMEGAVKQRTTMYIDVQVL